MSMPEMRRKLQHIPHDECLAMLRDGQFGTLAVHGAGGYSYAVPMNYALLDNGEELPIVCMHSAQQGHKIDAIVNDPKVCFTVVGQSRIVPERITDYFQSAIAFGRAWVENDPQIRLDALHALGEKYYAGFENLVEDDIVKSGPHCSIILMEIEQLTGKEGLDLAKARRE